jgi:hypothetical protein
LKTMMDDFIDSFCFNYLIIFHWIAFNFSCYIWEPNSLRYLRVGERGFCLGAGFISESTHHG